MAPLALVEQRETEAQQDEYLPSVAAGEARIAVGFSGLAGQTGAASVRAGRRTVERRRQRRDGCRCGDAFPDLPA